MTTDGKGYKLPDVINPGTAVCATVFIPNDPEYVAAFWGAYGFFGNWLAWQRDAAKRGKNAASVWRYWIEQSRLVWGEGNACTFPVADPVYPENPAAELQDILWYIKTQLEQVQYYIGIGTTPDEIIALMSNVIYTSPGFIDTINAMADYTAEELDAMLSAFSWESMFNDMWCLADCDLSTYSGPTGFFGWCQCALTKGLEWISGETGEVVGFLGDTLDVVSAAVLGDWAWLADGAGFDTWGWDAPICYDWVHEFDFTQSSHSFTILQQGGSNCGVWSDGVGWIAIYAGTQGAGGGYYVWLRSPVVADTSFQKARIYVAWDDDETYFRVVRTSARNNGGHVGYWSNVVVYTPPGPTPDDTEYVGEAARTGDQIELRLTMVHQGNPQPNQGDQSDGRVTRLILWGNGTDPF